MTNGDKIRNMTDEQLRLFLWTWTINTVSGFLQYGGKGAMNAADLKEWVKADASTFVCRETLVAEGFAYNQDFEEIQP